MLAYAPLLDSAIMQTPEGSTVSISNTGAGAQTRSGQHHMLEPFELENDISSPRIRPEHDYCMAYGHEPGLPVH